jgi:hypothetical protein
MRRSRPGLLRRISRAKPLAAAEIRASGMAAWMAAISGVAWIAVPSARGYWRRRKLRMSDRSGWRGLSWRSNSARLMSATDLRTEAMG